MRWRRSSGITSIFFVAYLEVIYLRQTSRFVAVLASLFFAYEIENALLIIMSSFIKINHFNESGWGQGFNTAPTGRISGVLARERVGAVLDGCYDNQTIGDYSFGEMDSETLYSNLDYLGSSGVVLSVEQKASLQSSLVTLRKDHKFKRVKLWGTIHGIQKEYFIVQGVGRNELLDRKALYR